MSAIDDDDCRRAGEHMRKTRHSRLECSLVLKRDDEIILGPIDLGPLESVSLRVSEDSVKSDLEVTCDLCSQHLCDAEHEDSIAVLARVATAHFKEKH